VLAPQLGYQLAVGGGVLSMFRKYAQIDTHAINYLHTGPSTLPDVVPDLSRGALVMLLPAAGGTARLWRPQLEDLERQHSAVAVDLPGHGRSSGVEGLASIAGYATFIDAFAGCLGLRSFVAVGRSMGGAIALSLALDHPARVKGLVLVATPDRFEIPSSALDTMLDVVRGRIPQQFTRDAFSPTTPIEVMKDVWREQVRTDPRVAYTDLLACQAFDVQQRLGDISVPTLVVAGADDRLVPPAAAERLAASIPGASCTVVAGAGHVVPTEQAAAFNQVLGDFLATLPQGAGGSRLEAAGGSRLEAAGGSRLKAAGGSR
jgi:pimeloyl-ACP methyl ester carboxylesterase